jgi:DNA-binding response OmpR family regulator
MTEEQLTRVLLVEDDCGVASLLQVALAEARRARFQVTHIERLGAAIQRLGEEAFDVVLLDLSLPDSQGLDTYTTAHRCAPDLPIVVLAGQDDEALAVKAIQAGAQDYILKEERESASLIRSLRYAIERHRMQTTIRSLTLTDALTGLCTQRGFTLAGRAASQVVPPNQAWSPTA